MSNKHYTNYNKPKKQESVEPTQEHKVIEEVVQEVEETIQESEVIEETVEETVQEEPKAVTGVVVNCKKLNVRSAPSLNAKINLTLSEGEGAVILDLVHRPDGEDFYKIGNPEHPDYVMAKYIKINN